MTAVFDLTTSHQIVSAAGRVAMQRRDLRAVMQGVLTSPSDPHAWECMRAAVTRERQQEMWQSLVFLESAGVGGGAGQGGSPRVPLYEEDRC